MYTFFKIDHPKQRRKIGWFYYVYKKIETRKIDEKH